jgi:diguanylate cyclase (GGDEF)-like protein
VDPSALSARTAETRPTLRLTPSVLVVEDEVVIAKDIESTLSELGYRVVGNVRSGTAALQAIEDTRPRLVLSDIRIKGDMDGIELAAIVKARFGTPVVFLSSHADETTLARVTATSPYGYIVKPFSARELRAGLELALLRHAQDAELEQRCITDELTGLHNRRGFVALAEHQLLVASRASRKAMLVFADINGLKTVNDTLGHDAGDHMLRDAAKALRMTFRRSDIIARLGGDEFAVLVVEPQPSARETLEKRLQGTIQQINSDGPRPYRLSMSMGICVWDSAAHPTLQHLLVEADAKMYRAKAFRKRHGSGRIRAVSSVGTLQRVPPKSASFVQPSTDAVSSLVHALNVRYPELEAHAKRVSQYTEILAQELGFPNEEASLVGRAAELHDIGQIAVPDEVLSARGKLDAEQLQLLKPHTTCGARILSGSDDAFLDRAAAIALGHHERWDGAGYPNQLRADECPLDARIVAAADAYDSVRPDTLHSQRGVVEWFRGEAGRRFDPRVVDALARSISALTELRRATTP